MVKNSLQSLLDKYPYFLNKNTDSNFYKVQWVNNENFKTLYNDLYKVYESFHLTKRLLVWKEQSSDYDYNINFVANYSNLKSVNIYKNNKLIYMETYDEDDSVDTFEFTYTCEYVFANIIKLNTYKCDDCNNIEFSINEQTTCSECSGSNLTKTYIYQCDDCGEIYFSTSTPTECSDCESENFTKLNAYNCSNCGQIYFSEELSETCPYCDIESTIEPTGTLYYDDPRLLLIDNSMEFDDDEDEEEDTNIIIGYPDYIDPEDENESFTSPADEISNIINDTYMLPVPIIPDDNFLITIETYDEYSLSKGFPEIDLTYDEYKILKEEDAVSDSDYYHDWSLDEFGALNDIPRKTYIDVDNPSLYNLTEPPYNNQGSEDDYHYMNRILEYNVRMWDTPAPVLEIWKLYGLEAELLNRERLLLKMFDVTKHEYDEDTGLVECWYPQPWEHKDKFCDGSTSLGEYFFVEADTVRPTIYQNVTITFKLLNSLAEEITDDYLVDIYYYLEEETSESKTALKLNHSDDYAVISYKVFEDNVDKTHVLQFIAHSDDGTEIGTEEVVLNIRDCDDGDWYVSETGDDTNGDGSSSNPFATLNKALEVVNKALDLIVVKGNLTLSSSASIPVVNTNCIILGCDNATITSEYNRQILHLAGSRDITVSLVNLILKNDEITSIVKNKKFTNNNLDFYDYETILIHGGEPVLSFELNQDEYYPYDYMNVNGVLTNKENIALTDKELTVLLDATELETITTEDSGVFDEWILLNNTYDTDTHNVTVDFNNINYFEKSVTDTFTYKEVTNYQVKYGQNITLTSSNHNENDEVSFYYADDNLIDTVTADSNGEAILTWKPDWGSYIVYVYEENTGESILDEWTIDTYITTDDLDYDEFIDSIEFTSDGEFNYTSKNITKLSDIDGLLIDLSFADDLRYTATYYELDTTAYTSEELEGNMLTPELYEVIKQAVLDIDVSDDGDVTLIRGDF